MSLKSKFAVWILDVLAYHPATQPSFLRSYVPGAYGDARKDLSSGDRRELQRLSRQFEAGNGIFNRMSDLWECYVVGASGLQFFPSSSSPEWNERAASRLAEWKPFADIASRDGFDVLQGRIARAWFVDGEVFILLTREGSFPRIQLIEAHRCQSPESAPKESRIFDGVEVSPAGRPIAYWLKLTDEEKLTRVDASYVVHVFEPSRPGQLRGIPLVSCVLNDLRDLDDLQILEMRAAKHAARIGVVQKNKAGEVSVTDAIRARYSVANTSPTGATATQARADYYQSSLGGDVLVLNSGDEIQQFMNNRPSVASRDYWRYLTEKICIGVGMPYVLVFPDSMQGTVYRGALDMAHAFFRARSAALQVHLQRVYEWVIGNDDSLIRGRPNDWRSTSVRPPKAVNVDVGRNAQAALALLAGGADTYQDFYSASGQDWKKQWRQKATEAAYKKQLAEEFGVSVEEIAASSLPAPEQPAQPQPDEPMPI